jgi:hypothetical protein
MNIAINELKNWLDTWVAEAESCECKTGDCVLCRATHDAMLAYEIFVSETHDPTQEKN